MTPLVAGFLFVVGLCLGSFANVLIARVPERRSIMGRSACPACQRVLPPWELVPVLSWIALRRRCRGCGTTIPLVYPVVEVLGGLMAVASGLLVPGPVAAAGWMLFGTLALALAVIDIRDRILPDELVLAAFVIGWLALGLDAVLEHAWLDYGRAWAAAGILVGLFGLIRLLSRGGMGLGDVKLAAPVGFFLGFEGWGPLVLGVFCGFLLGAVVGVALILVRRAGRRTALPFGPFMLAGAWLGLWLAPGFPWSLFTG